MLLLVFNIMNGALSYPLLTPMLTPPLRHSFDAIMGQGHADSQPLYICMSTLRVCVYVRGLRRRRESRNKEFSSNVSTKELASISVLCKASSRDPYKH